MFNIITKSRVEAEKCRASSNHYFGHFVIVIFKGILCCLCSYCLLQKTLGANAILYVHGDHVPIYTSQQRLSPFLPIIKNQYWSVDFFLVHCIGCNRCKQPCVLHYSVHRRSFCRSHLYHIHLRSFGETLSFRRNICI